MFPITNSPAQAMAEDLLAETIQALAAKAVLWPIAGIALLGAAAALVSNPILLQLGVASGKRRRRNTEEITGPEFSTEITEWRPLIKRNVASIKTGNNKKSSKTKPEHRKAKINELSTTQRITSKRNPTTESSISSYSPLSEESNELDEINFVPIPIKSKFD
ncbi:jg12571 [Pararge aegeria aegeria]|uniref:Jg12571 protein n=1 Tax=Pararge aegeria aegeria TaxID=348720 RepID=A0A8S4SEJ3_9NEOP|nr:jg12571 [Pararge aegeria aegeria]